MRFSLQDTNVHRYLEYIQYRAYIINNPAPSDEPNRCLAAVADAVEVAADHAVVRAADHAVVRAAALVVHRAVAAPVVGDVAVAVVEDAAVNERSAAGVRAVFSTICHVV
ncbi:unnamed protein product [Arctia plantaginis]|uniref:Uncharacterized protein n=1 Tax=Arctia plantaginis TaxID=874455 RepID=A0A8S0ZEF6_ARCPL|nr:unnamed protein product [Arctia plantaginis]